MTIDDIYFTVLSRKRFGAKDGRVMNNQERCSYKCQHYRDGAVMSICNKYKSILRYDGSIPPLKCEQCIKDRESRHE